MVAASFLSTLFLSLAVAAKTNERAESFTTLPLTKLVSANRNIVNLDRLRVNYIVGYDVFDVISTSAEQVQASFYTALVGVGSPPTTYRLLIDTGSSNTWLGADKPYVKTSTSHQTNESVSVRYGIGNFNGTEYIDKVTIAPGLEIPMQSIGVASAVANLSGFDGILGLGPLNLTNNTLSPDKHFTIPTVVHNLYAEGKIAKEVIGISFEPLTNSSVNATQLNGEISWGGVDYGKFIGEIYYTPITTTYRSSNYWGIDACVTYGEDTPLPSLKSGIVDTGTTQILFSTDAYQSYMNATGAVFDPDTGLPKITSAQYENLESIYIEVNGVPELLELTPNAQIFPRSQNVDFNGTADGIYLVVSDLGPIPIQGLDFILGLSFLERFYSVYDTTEARVGLAMTGFTYADTN